MAKYKADYEFISSRRLGELKAIWAPNVPTEFAAAMVFRESSFGSNPAAAIANSTGNKGAYQISTKAGGYYLGRPESIAEANYPKALGQLNVDDQEHLAIAGLRKLSKAWQKFDGNELAVSRDFYGKGETQVNGKNDNAGTYLGRIKETIAELHTLPRSGDYFAGEADMSKMLATSMSASENFKNSELNRRPATDTTTVTQPPTAEDNFLLNLMGMGA